MIQVSFLTFFIVCIVLLIVIDSVSRSSWLQRLPKTSKFIFETMKFELLKGYNIIGDGTPGNYYTSKLFYLILKTIIAQTNY